MDKMLKATVVLSAVDRMSRVVNDAVQKSSRSLERMEQATQGVADLMGGSMLVDAVARGIGASITAAEESEVAQRRLAQVFKSMGETTGEAAARAAEYASALSAQIGQEDEAIMAAQAKLATFEAVSNSTARMSGVFDRATKAAFDLAAAGFGDASSASVQLGKALQDPIKGITALRKSGVTFTQAEQDKIRALVESGRLLDAQNIILKAVETQVGGVAAATATDSAKMRIAFGEVTESIGKALLPVVQQITETWIPLLQNFAEFLGQHPGLVQAIIGIAGALLTFAGVVKIVTGLQQVLNITMWGFPVFAIIGAIIALAAVIYTYWDEIVVFMQGVWERIKGPLAPLIAFFKLQWALAVGIFNVIKAVLAGFVQMWAAQFRAIGDAATWIYDGVARAVTWVQDKFWSLVEWFQNLPTLMYEAGSNMITSLWEGIKAMAWAPIQAVSDIASSIRDYFPFSPAKQGALRDIHKIKLMETVAASIKPGPVLSAVQSATGSIANSLQGGATGGLLPAGGGGVINFSPTITVNGGAPGVEGNIREMLNQFMPDLIKQIGRVQERNNRKTF